MSLHRSLLSAALLAVACGCAQNEPQESTTSREIAKLERELADTRPASAEPAARTTAAPRVGTVVPEVVDLTAAAPLTTAVTLSPLFAAAVNDGRGFIVRGLIIRTPPTPEAQVEADIAAARAKMHEAKALA